MLAQCCCQQWWPLSIPAGAAGWGTPLSRHPESPGAAAARARFPAPLQGIWRTDGPWPDLCCSFFSRSHVSHCSRNCRELNCGSYLEPERVPEFHRA